MLPSEPRLVNGVSNIHQYSSSRTLTSKICIKEIPISAAWGKAELMKGPEEGINGSKVSFLELAAPLCMEIREMLQFISPYSSPCVKYCFTEKSMIYVSPVSNMK